MAMAGVGLGGVSLAEAYAMRSLHKEKMKKMEKQKAVTAADVVVAGRDMKASSGCFFWASKTKKTHSAKVSSAESEQKLQQVDQKWDYKS